ncbi:MAG: lipid-A-disaccharide synthase [Nitratiruptor sp.]|nr:lipid-A-disaccharide synthase [Nitratiruptor sp.]NPA84209.1 lipid-A-disaccharide synthase [Campylobacterota bacterium]
MKLLVSALEPSANLHLRHLLTHLKATPIGIFEASLGNPIADLRERSVMGFVDALRQLPYFLSLQRQMVQLAEEADKVLLIDGSGFNLPLAQAIKKRHPHKEIIYYILPQAWAWRKGRIKKIVQYVDQACSILPFEAAYYPPDYPIHYVGHPLLDTITQFKEEPRDDGPILFMPGSRPGEIQRLMPVFRAIRPLFDREALLVIPPHFSPAIRQRLYGDLSAFHVTSDPYEAMGKASFAFVCSGTATLEAALIGTPQVLVYIARSLDYLIAKHLVQIRQVGLANILLGDVHPELLQGEVNPANLLQAYHRRDPEKALQRAKALRSLLKSGSAAQVARIVRGHP